MTLLRILVLAVTMTATILSFGAEGKGKVRFIKGEVSISTETGEGKELEEGQEVAAKDIIRTGADSFAILVFEDGSTVKIDPESEVEIKSLIKKSSKNEEYKGTSSVVLSIGDVFIRVIKKFQGEPPLEVKTKTVAVGVRGTEFFVGIDPKEDSTWTSVKSGQIEVLHLKNDDHEIVKKGHGLVVERGGRLTRPAKFDWSKKLNWNFNPKKGSLRGQFKKLAAVRRKEFKRRGAELRQRKPRPYREMRLKMKKKWKKSRAPKRAMRSNEKHGTKIKKMVKKRHGPNEDVENKQKINKEKRELRQERAKRIKRAVRRMDRKGRRKKPVKGPGLPPAGPLPPHK
jgi:hypothetical protein